MESFAPEVNAEIITIGDELLIGQVVDTNSAWLGNQLSMIGVKVHQITSVSDSREHILRALRGAEERVDIILITGGLGPTKDDITKATLCEYFNTRLIVNEEVLEMVRRFFEKRGRPFTELNQKQAEVPESCTAIKNPVGTAPCMQFERNGKLFFSMPGVPYEMKTIMEQSVLSKIKKSFNLPFIYHKTVLTQGIGESFLAERIEKWEESLIEQNIKLAYLPSPGQVRLRLSTIGMNESELKSKVSKKIDELFPLVSGYIYGFEEIGSVPDTLERIVGELLIEKGNTIALAESCTGGYLTHLITKVPGSSAYFNGSIVPYHNRFKGSLLEVGSEIFEKWGAVSEECVKQMLHGVIKQFNSDYGVAISGIAGPTGGTEEKPVGTVWIAVGNTKNLVTEKFIFGNDRERNINMSSLTALNMIRKFILER